MRIQVEASCCYKGDIYRFTRAFERWLEAELEKRIEVSKAFAKSHGQDWTLSFGWDTGKRTKKPKIDGPWTDRKSKETRRIVQLPWFRYVSPEPQAYVLYWNNSLAALPPSWSRNNLIRPR